MPRKCLLVEESSPLVIHFECQPFSCYFNLAPNRWTLWARTEPVPHAADFACMHSKTANQSGTQSKSATLEAHQPC